MNLGEASLKNYEHISITEDIDMIQEFKQRFDNMFNDPKKFADYYPEQKLEEKDFNNQNGTGYVKDDIMDESDNIIDIPD